MVFSGDFPGRVLCHWPRKKGTRGCPSKLDQQVLNPTPLNPTPATCHKRRQKLSCNFRTVALRKLQSRNCTAGARFSAVRSSFLPKAALQRTKNCIEIEKALLQKSVALSWRFSYALTFRIPHLGLADLFFLWRYCKSLAHDRGVPNVPEDLPCRKLLDPSGESSIGFVPGRRSAVRRVEIAPDDFGVEVQTTFWGGVSSVMFSFSPTFLHPPQVSYEGNRRGVENGPYISVSEHVLIPADNSGQEMWEQFAAHLLDPLNKGPRIS